MPKNNIMNKEEIVQLAQNFIDNNPSCNEALKQLKPGTEIKLNFVNKYEIGLFLKNDICQINSGKIKNFDVEFVLNTEAIRQLADQKSLSVAEVGTEFLKQALLGHIEIKKHSGVIKFISNGYLKIVKLAGPDFLNFLAKHGLGSIQKIVSYIKKS